MSKLQISKRLDGVSDSATLRLNAAVQAMKAQGIDVTNLTAGEPDFNVPDSCKEAMMEAVRTNKSKYTPVGGIPDLRMLVAEKTNQQQPALQKLLGKAPWAPANVLVACGAKQSVFNAILATVSPGAGEQVLIPSPYWLSYPEIVKLAGGVPKIVECTFEEKFKLTPSKLRRALDAGSGKYRAIIFNSPSNPTGSMYSREEFQELGRVLAEHSEAKGMWIISDEIYDSITLSKTPFCSFLEAAPQLWERTITINGLSKSAAMTGWRIGWSVAPKMATDAMSTLQGQSTSGINAPTQWAGVAALKLSPSVFAENAQIYKKRAELALEILKNAGKIKVLAPEGAFYLFVGIESYLREGEDSIQFAERLLNDAKVAVVPGTPFGEPRYLRLSFATDEKTLREGCERITRFLNSPKQSSQ